MATSVPARRGTIFTKSVQLLREKTRLNFDAVKAESTSRDYSKDQPPLENTYRTEPSQLFSSQRAERLINDILEHNLTGVTYERKTVAELTKRISTQLSSEVKLLRYARYKFVFYVVIGELKEQQVQVGSRCVWNPASDCQAWGSYRSKNIFASAMIFGIYFD